MKNVNLYARKESAVFIGELKIATMINLNGAKSLVLATIWIGLMKAILKT